MILFKKYFWLVIAFVFLNACSHTDWRTADRSSVGLAPKPEMTAEAIVHVYAARTVNWRGYFAVHSWIATKEKNGSTYTTYHVMGFRLRRTGSAVVIEKDIPDRKWFGAVPVLVQELKGPQAEKAIPQIQKLAETYPYADRYSAWPGPNSNTFISYIIRQTPELTVELPPHAIGRDWLTGDQFFAPSESKTGYQFSAYGVFGLNVGLAEGIEFNLLGLNFGVDLWRPALKLPLIGRVGFTDAPVFD